jgi:hypothetical protein
MKKQWLVIWGFIMLATLIFVGCSKTENNSKTTSVALYLTDGPADYDALLLDIQKVEIHTEPGGWQSFPLMHAGIYDLLQLNNGIDTLLCHADLPVATISQIRLILGNNNTIVVNGVNHPLQTPSAQQSGLKINVHQTLEPSLVYKMWLDFDAGKSVVEKGNGDYLLKPVIRGYTELTNGIISGTTLPIIAQPVVYAIQNNDTIATAIPMPNGYFKFCGLVAGNYTVAIVPSVPHFSTLILQNVTVSFGEANNLGTLTILP